MRSLREGGRNSIESVGAFMLGESIQIIRGIGKKTSNARVVGRKSQTYRD